MKLIKTLTALAFAVALLAGPAIAGAETCCEKAAKEGKECKRKCCVSAHKEGKSCEKCNPNKEDQKSLKKKGEKKEEKEKK